MLNKTISKALIVQLTVVEEQLLSKFFLHTKALSHIKIISVRFYMGQHLTVVFVWSQSFLSNPFVCETFLIA